MSIRRLEQSGLDLRYGYGYTSFEPPVGYLPRYSKPARRSWPGEACSMRGRVKATLKSCLNLLSRDARPIPTLKHANATPCCDGAVRPSAAFHAVCIQHLSKRRCAFKGDGYVCPARSPEFWYQVQVSAGSCGGDARDSSGHRHWSCPFQMPCRS